MLNGEQEHQAHWLQPPVISLHPSQTPTPPFTAPRPMGSNVPDIVPQSPLAQVEAELGTSVRFFEKDNFDDIPSFQKPCKLPSFPHFGSQGFLESVEDMMDTGREDDPDTSLLGLNAQLDSATYQNLLPLELRRPVAAPKSALKSPFNGGAISSAKSKSWKSKKQVQIESPPARDHELRLRDVMHLYTQVRFPSFMLELL
ncbi:hypothetical protein BT69DRAFT_1329609 [Atractiella rhizophila]|nr:hypothetical protein BT69DRAFT_1329609 [Atractiella rhizophila]